MAAGRRFDEHLTLQPTAPFDFEQSLAFLRGFTPCSGDHRCERGALTTGGFADGVPFLARVEPADAAESGAETAAGGAGAPSLSVAVHWVESDGDPEAVADWLRAFLSLDDDLGLLYDAARDDPAFGPVVEDLHGYHHVRFSTPFEAACWAALSQRTPMSVARSLKRDLVETCGRVVTVGGEAVSLFPTPAMVHDAAPRVRAAIDHDRKCRTVLGAAEAFATGDLRSLDDDELRARLADVWGFGDWSSEFVALRGFGRLSGLPRSERRLREAVGDLYDLDGAATDADLDRLSEPYAPLRGYWAHYIRVWVFRRSLDD